MSVVFHDGSLVRVIPSSDKTSLSMLCSPSSRAEREFLEQDPKVHGWVLDHDDQLLHIFLFCKANYFNFGRRTTVDWIS